MWIDLHDRARLSLSAAARRSKKKKNECHALIVVFLIQKRKRNSAHANEIIAIKKIKDISLSPAEYYTS
jgi:hypothetical protein